KFKIIKNQINRDYFVYDAMDKIIERELKKRNIKANKLPFSLKEITGEGAGITKDKIEVILKEETFSMPVEEIGLAGEHNTKNALAASTVANLLKIRKKTIRESLKNFQGVEHRLEKVRRVEGVEYINDSKATNL